MNKKCLKSEGKSILERVTAFRMSQKKYVMIN